MNKCKKCKKEFKVTDNAIEIIYATYCSKCIRSEIIKLSKIDINYYISMQLKQVIS